MLAKLLVAAAAATALSQALAPPVLPFLEWKACPFEGCVYRRWIAQEKVQVFNTWEERRRPIAQLSRGDAVVGITGLVITSRPGRIRMDRDLPEQKLKAGDIILTYTNRGEGFSGAWLAGRYDPSFDISFTKWPDGSGCGGAHCAATYVDLGAKVWWAQIRLKSGRTGWVNMNTGKFDGLDMLARGRYQGRGGAVQVRVFLQGPKRA
ncbi:MAG TPA: hypothetical protein VGM43_25855 [Bryobacteraceae bacterium]|jgi:hypothetical protein